MCQLLKIRDQKKKKKKLSSEDAVQQINKQASIEKLLRLHMNFSYWKIILEMGEEAT